MLSLPIQQCVTLIKFRNLLHAQKRELYQDTRGNPTN